jgi:hypothetical protein
MIPMSLAQEPCDFNENGFPDITDMIRAANLLNHIVLPDSVAYWPEADCDCDSVHLTISDILGLYFRMIDGYGWGNGQLIESGIDTLAMPAIVAYPGQVREIPIFLSTARELNGIQLYVTYDPAVITIGDFAWSDSAYGGPPYVTESGFAAYSLSWLPRIFPNPIGYLSVQISGEAIPQETRIAFSDNPYHALYTGLSTSDTAAEPPDPRVSFIRPIKVDGIIDIVQTGVAEQPQSSDKPELRIYANPANASYVIRFYLPSDGYIRLELFNIVGQAAAGIIRGEYSSGWHEITWDGTRLASGVYFARLITENESVSAKLTLLK